MVCILCKASNHGGMITVKIHMFLPCRSLSYNRNQTLFRLGRSPFEPITREISLSNQFDVPLVLYDIRIPTKAQDFFSVSGGPNLLKMLTILASTSFLAISSMFAWEMT